MFKIYQILYGLIPLVDLGSNPSFKIFSVIQRVNIVPCIYVTGLSKALKFMLWINISKEISSTIVKPVIIHDSA